MQSDEQEIRQLVATWMAATKAGDIDTVLPLMTEDVVFLLPGRPPMIGKRSPQQRKLNQTKDRFSSTARARFKRSRCWETGRLCGQN
jgi:uncharacterized protein (TIGR02246 family)